MTRKEYARNGRSATAEANDFARKWRREQEAPIVCPYSFELYSDEIKVSLELEKEGGR